MKAVRIHEHGGAEKLRYEDAPEPELVGPRDAIIELRAASVNRSDIQARSGLTRTPSALPHILGADGAGVVAKVGGEVNNLKPGDAVCLYPLDGCGSCEFCATDRDNLCAAPRNLGEQENGTYAAFVKAPARNCFSFPFGLSFAEAAALPSVYLAVWKMLISLAKVKPGEHVLIVGAGGGIGTAALQLAVNSGAHVIAASGSDEKLDKAHDLGAEQGVNYQSADIAKEVRRFTGKRGVDVVVDCVGGEGWVKSLAALAKGGRLVICGAVAGDHPKTDLKRIFWNHLNVFGSTLGSRHEFAQVLHFLQSTGAKPVLDRVFPLREAAAAQRRMENGSHFGKIVLQIDA